MKKKAKLKSCKVRWKSTEDKDGRFSIGKILRRELEMGREGHLCREVELEDGGRLRDAFLPHPLLRLLLLMLPFVYLKQ